MATTSGLLVDTPVHELTAGGDQEDTPVAELKALLQDSRNWPMHQAACYAHQRQNLRIRTGGRYVLLGRNGCGKSTLLRAIRDRNNGLASFPAEVSVFMLDQELQFLDRYRESNALETVLEHAGGEVTRLEAEATRLEDSLGDEDAAEEAASRLCEIYDKLDALGGEGAAVEREREARHILECLGFRNGRESSPIGTLSGGWRCRVGLACALLASPQLLLLDEPTNHLDIACIAFLARYLRESYRGDAILFVTHDRTFAEEVATDVIVFANASLTYHSMGLVEYERAAEEKRKKTLHQAALLDKKKQHIAKQKEAASRAAHAGDAKAGSQASKLAKKLGRTGLEKTADGKRFNAQSHGVRVGANNDNTGGWKNGKMTSLPLLTKAAPELGFGFAKCEGSAVGDDEAIFELRSPRFRYPGASADAVSCGEFPIGAHARLAICGRNGQGKTTLLRLLVGELSPTSGEVRRNSGYRILRFGQDSAEALALDPRTPLQAACELQSMRESDARNHLGRFGIQGDQALRPMERLSGGQRVRVAMALGALAKPHVLLLDEPT